MGESPIKPLAFIFYMFQRHIDFFEILSVVTWYPPVSAVGFLQVPAFRHGANIINESVAACMYLEVIYSGEIQSTNFYSTLLFSLCTQINHLKCSHGMILNTLYFHTWSSCNFAHNLVQGLNFILTLSTEKTKPMLERSIAFPNYFSYL